MKHTKKVAKIYSAVLHKQDFGSRNCHFVSKSEDVLAPNGKSGTGNA